MYITFTVTNNDTNMTVELHNDNLDAIAIYETYFVLYIFLSKVSHKAMV